MYIRFTEVRFLIFLKTTNYIFGKTLNLTQLTTDNDSCQGQEGPEDILNLESEDEEESSTTSSVIAFEVEEEILIEREMEEHATATLATDEAQG